MRRGMKPTDACLETLKRVVQLTEPRLLGPDGKPTFDLKFYAVNKRGEFGAASLNPARYAAHDGTEAKLRDMAHLHERAASGSQRDRKSTRLNSSHVAISYAVFCLKK